MSKNELKYTPIGAYKVGNKILTCVSSWNGLEELMDQQGQKLIVARSKSGSFRESFGQMFSALGMQQEPSSMTVLSGTPDLLVELGLITKDHA